MSGQEEIDADESEVAELYEDVPPEVLDIIKRTLELEQANLHYDRPPDIVQKIAERVRLAIPERP